MYDVIFSIINHGWTTGTSEQQYIYYICGAVICLFFVVIVDSIRDIFSAICRG